MRRFRRTTVVFIDLVSIAHTLTRRSYRSAATRVARSTTASSATPSSRMPSIPSCWAHHTSPLSLPSPLNIIGPFPFAVTPIDTDMCPYSPPSEPPFFTFPHYLILDASSVAVALCLKLAQSWPARAGQRRPCTYTHSFLRLRPPPIPLPLLTTISVFPAPSHPTSAASSHPPAATSTPRPWAAAVAAAYLRCLTVRTYLTLVLLPPFFDRSLPGGSRGKCTSTSR